VITQPNAEQRRDLVRPHPAPQAVVHPWEGRACRPGGPYGNNQLHEQQYKV